MTRLAQMLRLYRLEKGLTTRTVADEIGIPVPTLNRIERSQTGLTAGNFLRISTWQLQPPGTGRRIRK